MSGNLAIYVVCFEYADGALLAETQSISIDRETGAQRVATLAKGWAGVTPGVAMCTFTVEAAVPAAGFEFDAGKKMAGLIPTKLYTLGPGGKQFKGEAIILGDSFKQGVGQAAAYTFRAEGPFSLWS